LVRSPRMYVFMTIAARNDDNVMSVIFMQKYVPEIRLVNITTFIFVNYLNINSTEAV